MGADSRHAAIKAGGDKGYDTFDFVRKCRNLRVTLQWRRTISGVARVQIDERTTRHPRHRISQVKRKRIKEYYGWLKTIPLLRKVRLRGILKVTGYPPR